MTRLLPPATSQGIGPAVVPVADILAAESASPLPIPEPLTGSEDDPALIIFTRRHDRPGQGGGARAPFGQSRTCRTCCVVSKRPAAPARRRPAASEVMLLSGPLFHIGGVQALLLALLGGNAVVFLEGRFDPGRCWTSSSASG